MIEGSGSGSIPLTNGSRSRRPKNMWIRWIRIRIRIRNTGIIQSFWHFVTHRCLPHLGCGDGVVHPPHVLLHLVVRLPEHVEPLLLLLLC
jgi:hypothetical protein